MRNMLNADYGCRVHSTSSASWDMMFLDASCHMVASTILVTIMHPSNAWSLILLTVGGITILRSDVCYAKSYNTQPPCQTSRPGTFYHNTIFRLNILNRLVAKLKHLWLRLPPIWSRSILIWLRHQCASLIDVWLHLYGWLRNKSNLTNQKLLHKSDWNVWLPTIWILWLRYAS